MLIAGSNGFIGSHLLNSLCKQYDVYGIGNEESAQPNYKKVDLRNPESIREYLNNIDKIETLIFLTGLAHAKGKDKQYNEFYEVNVQTLINLLDELEATGKLPSKIIFASTISTYGEDWEKVIYKEDDLQNPKSPYAKTKVEAEKYLLSKYRDISWIIRFAPVYAENFTLNIDRRTKIRNRYYYVGNGDVKLSLLNVENIKKVVYAILQNKIPSGIYNLSDKKVYTYQDLLNWQKAGKKLLIPKFMMYLVYHLGKLIKKNFFIENSIKLSTDNIFTSENISKFIDLDHQLTDIKCIAE
jgi:nucleoside-diphosphate-sugar epimerase